MFRGLLESAPDGIVVVDGSGHIVIVNGQAERMFGYARQELLGQSIEILVPERYRAAHAPHRGEYAEAPRTRPMGAGRLLTGRKRDGTEFPVEISLSPLDTANGVLVTSIVRDVTERRRAEEQITASLREKELLLKEIHHRVKNNLQVTSSLLKLQAQLIRDPHAREMFAESHNRIRSMALVHEKLYQARDLSRVDFGDYARSLAALLLRSFGVDRERIRLTVIADEVYLAIDTAVPCGLVLNELLSNAFKHAFPDGRRGEVTVTVARKGGRVVVGVRDDGVGLGPDARAAGAETLGLQLVGTLVRQLRAELGVRSEGGTELEVSFAAGAKG